MKSRIKIDNVILSGIIILTGFLYLYSNLYPHNQVVSYIFSFIGMVVILKGTLFRMAGRGHKKANSKKSEELVSTGIYSLVRNPMYLGSFLIGAGFVLIAWPWWMLPVFAGLFYLRFNKQMVHEEKFLSKAFGKKYEQYCSKVPRILPSWQSFQKVKFRNVFNSDEIFSTKERNGLWTWPLLAMAVESFKQAIVYGYTDIPMIVFIFAVASATFFVTFWIEYERK